jgi:MFS transporter, ACS family, glucarate transporter
LTGRTRVLILLCSLSAITFLDRLAIAVTEPGIRTDLQLGPDQWGWILSAYVLANALFEIPSGARGDRRGQRSELTRIVAWWSGFTAATGWCRNFLQMVGARFLFGLGTAGAYPNASGVIVRWFPQQEHARAQGFIWAAGRMGAAFAPLLLVPIERVWGWRAVFSGLGALGIVWATVWWVSFRSEPEGVPRIAQKEFQHTAATSVPHAIPADIPWRRLVALPQLWLIMAAYFCYAWGSWFFFGWFTTWMVQGEGFSIEQMGIFASFPFVVAMFGNLIGGTLSRNLVLKIGAVNAYRWISASCLVVGAALLLAMSVVRGHAAVVALATASFGVMDLMLPSAWAMCMGLGGRCGGTATAMMNTAGNLGGWVCALIFGYVVKTTGSYSLPLQLVAVMVLVAAFLFARVNCTHGLLDL